MFCCGIAIRFPISIVIPATAATIGIHATAAEPTPSTYRRMIATNPAAFGATDSHATNGVLAAS
jgi:hypothetical protein